MNEIPKEHLETRDHWSDNAGKLLMGKVISPIVKVILNTEGKVIGKTPELLRERDIDTPAVATDAAKVVPAKERWRLIQIRVQMTADLNAANRQLNVTVTPGAIGAAFTLNDIVTTGITLTAGQQGQILMTEGHAPNQFTNTNGVSAVVADENPLGEWLEAAGIITAASTNKQVGDVIALEVIHETELVE